MRLFDAIKRVVVDGLTAANTSVSQRLSPRARMLTDARLRPIHLGNQQIHFKTVAPSRLYWPDDQRCASSGALLASGPAAVGSPAI
jgi:hypothetical protein